MRSTPEKKAKGMDTALPDPSSFITNWSQALTSFQGQFKLLAGAINTIEQQPSGEISTNRRPQLNKLKKSRAESIQVLEQLLVDMDGVYSLNQSFPQVSMSHTIRLQKQTERMQRVLRVDNFPAMYTTADNKTARA